MAQVSGLAERGKIVKAARIIFGLAAAWGFIALTPGLFGEVSFSIAMPPAITHPEFYYGFYGLAMVFQLIFVLIAIDPKQNKHLIPIAILEKLAFFLPCMWLFSERRMAVGGPFYGAIIDGIWAIIFVAVWWMLHRKSSS